MEDFVIASISFNGCTKLINLLNCTLFAEVVYQCYSSWIHLRKRKFSFKAKVGSMVNVALGTQADLDNVFTLCKLSGINVVYVEIIIDTVGPNFNSDVVGDGGAVDTDLCRSRLVDGGGDDVVQIMGDPVNLLSDGWGELVKGGVGVSISGGAESFMIALIKYAFKFGFRFVYVRNTKEKIIVVCCDAKNASCKWYIKAKLEKIDDAFTVVEVNFEHNCFVNLARAACHSSMCPRLMDHLLMPNARRNAKLKASDVVDVMKLGYGVEVPYWKARCAAQHAKELVFGGYDDSYDNLRSYCEAVKLTNPDSVPIYQSDIATSTFEKVYISFNASIEGFRHYPPMLFVDGTFLRGRAKCTLLIDVAKDSNNGFFPVAFAVVSAENTENWCWFLSIARDTLKHDKKICFLSDRNAGLLAALPVVFESLIHYYCLYHLIMNLRGKCSAGSIKSNKSLLVKLFKECAYAPNKLVFSQKFENFLRVGGNTVTEWTSHLPFEKWALAYCVNANRYGDMTSNAAESFNAWAVITRTKPITHMFKHMRRGCRWFVEQ